MRWIRLCSVVLGLACVPRDVCEDGQCSCSTVAQNEILREYVCPRLDEFTVADCVARYHASIPNRFHTEFVFLVEQPGSETLNLKGLVWSDRAEDRLKITLRDHVAELDVVRMVQSGDDLTLMIYALQEGVWRAYSGPIDRFSASTTRQLGFDILVVPDLVRAQLPISLEDVTRVRPLGADQFQLDSDGRSVKAQFTPNDEEADGFAGMPLAVIASQHGLEQFSLTYERPRCDVVRFDNGMAHVVKFPQVVRFRHYDSGTKLTAGLEGRIEWYARLDDGLFQLSVPASALPLVGDSVSN